MKSVVKSEKGRIGAGSQAGAALFIALISLVIMTLAGLAAIRSVDIGSVIAGNFAFKRATLNATDVGVETALTQIDATIIPTSRDADFPAGCTANTNPACSYYATQQATNNQGVPSNIVWANVPIAVVNNNYQVQYVIDRLCDGPVPVTDIQGKCYSVPSTSGSGGTKKAGGIAFSGASEVFYRTTVRVTGPRNTVSMVQVLLAH